MFREMHEHAPTAHCLTVRLSNAAYQTAICPAAKPAAIGFRKHEENRLLAVRHSPGKPRVDFLPVVTPQTTAGCKSDLAQFHCLCESREDFP
jgi:hypothetical protein